MLVVGAPAMVGMLDDSIEYRIGAMTDLSDKKIVSGTSKATAGEEYTELAAFTSVSDANSNVMTWTSKSIKELSFLTDLKVKDFLNAKVGKTTFTINQPGVKSVGAGFYYGGVYTMAPAEFDEASGKWVLEYSSLNLAKMETMNEENSIFRIGVTLSEPATMTTMTIGTDHYEMITIVNSAIIMGAVGVLLMVCAILATPWFGLDGIRGRR